MCLAELMNIKLHSNLYKSSLQRILIDPAIKYDKCYMHQNFILVFQITNNSSWCCGFLVNFILCIEQINKDRQAL